MPILPSHILSNLIMPLRLFQNLRIDLYYPESLFLALKTALHLAHKRHGYLTQPHRPVVVIPSRVRKDNTTSILECSRRQCGFEKQGLSLWVQPQPVSRAVTSRPEGGDDYYLCALPDQGTEGFWKCEVPADQDAYGT